MTSVQVQPPAPDTSEPEAVGGRRLLAGLAGLVAAAVALGVAELVAALVGPASSPVIAVGDAAIPLTPEPVKTFAIETFGANDKLALVVGTLVVVAVYAVAIGLVGLRSRLLGALGVALFGLVGAVAAITRPEGSLADALPSLVGAAAGILALLALLAPLTVPRGTGGTAEVLDAPGAGLDRRRFLVTGGVALGAAALAGGAGRFLQRRFAVAGERADLLLPAPASRAAGLPAGADLAADVDGLTPLFTSNQDFYRIDTAILAPQVRPRDYRLELAGMFDSPGSYALADLFDRTDLIERDITITCVSNEVGGTLAGTARWLGVPLGTFLRENGIRSSSTQLVCRDVSGMTIGAPTRAALETDDAMLAIGMNGEPLPVAHGFPVRMLIPGLYGYVSACKWLARIEATTFDAYDAYWVERGWAQQARIKVASRIDTPSPLRDFPAGRRAIAGVAWAQTRGIARVEVRVDDGDWADAELSPEVDADIWRQWVLPYDFRPGLHTVRVRATSADGEVQTEERSSAAPDGATGWHTIQVTAG